MDRLVAGRYRLAERLGAGAYGTVWRAVDELLDVNVAVKEIRLHAAVTDPESSGLLARVVHEAKVVALLRDHPNVVTVLDVVHEGDLPWIVMEWIPSRSLAEVVGQEGPLAARDVARVGLEVLNALVAAHAAGIVHRDVKPANILLGDDGRIVLVDFGVAVLESHSTVTQSPLGTLAYMAPERFSGARATSASDLFSLGVTLYTAAEGVSPFARETEAATVAAVLSYQPEPPRRAEALGTTILSLIDKDPDVRLGAPGARDALADALAGLTGLTGPGSTVEYGESYLGRAVGVGLAVGAAVGAAVPWIVQGFVDPPTWAFIPAAFWSVVFAVWTAALVAPITRPGLLTIGPDGIRCRRFPDDLRLAWSEVADARVHGDVLEIERRADPEGTVETCRLWEFHGTSAGEIEAVLSAFRREAPTR
ncbi:serine/threonine-protein kinase [Parafrankia discariae]|uniref:serine/threonine-protein kinase n=1 Tax=Parafrankia discariae TaxID=365528 RepID=UPI0006862256|nr:serine/threonine-protein kinase [Parafrankia discariae]